MTGDHSAAPATGNAPRWTLEVEGLGRIRRASVRPRPLMLFVGQNNSGKSYLATLLWGLLARTGDLFVPPLESPELTTYQACDAWLAQIVSTSVSKPIHEIGVEDQEMFRRWLNSLLSRNGPEFIRKLFNNPSLPAPRIHLAALNASLTLDLMPLTNSEQVARGLSVGNTADRVALQGPLPIEGVNRKFTLDTLAAYMLVFPALSILGNLGPSSQRPLIYMPASRTGFMLTYPALVQQQLRRGLGGMAFENQVSTPLTLPVVDFLEQLASVSRYENGPFAEEAAILESQALQGTLEVRSRLGLNQFIYRPRNLGAPEGVSMHLSSSLVTELSPLVYVLRQAQELRVLIFEEPEAHLHPYLQRVLAQVMVRLIRKGVCVWITTHSENFCQQINNFIKLGTLSERESLQTELGYAAQDFLLPQEVGGYQFTVAPDGLTDVTELETSDDGVVMPSFNEELYRLVEETARLQRAREESA